MKTGIIVALIGFLILFLVPSGFAATRTLTFAWDKSIIEPDLAKFELQTSTDAVWDDYVADQNPQSGTWQHLTYVNFVPEQTSYVEDKDFIVIDGSEDYYFFRIRAIDNSDNMSDWCYGTMTGPCRAHIDFKSPGLTINFEVVVKEAE